MLEQEALQIAWNISSLVIPGMHNSLMFSAHKQCPRRGLVAGLGRYGLEHSPPPPLGCVQERHASAPSVSGALRWDALPAKSAREVRPGTKAACVQSQDPSRPPFLLIQIGGRRRPNPRRGGPASTTRSQAGSTCTCWLEPGPAAPRPSTGDDMVHADAPPDRPKTQSWSRLTPWQKKCRGGLL
jgi:hypothetical protein